MVRTILSSTIQKNGNLVIFGGMHFRDEKSGDLIDIIAHTRYQTKFKLINTIICYYKMVCQLIVSLLIVMKKLFGW